MDDQKNGESSRSPVHTGNGGPKSRLILPEWDVPPPKHLHSSHDLITLLHLEGQYNTYVRPFTDPSINPATGGLGSIGDITGVDAADGDVKVEPGDAGAVQVNAIPGMPPVLSAAAMRKKAKKKRRLERGYAHLLEDVMDPTPLGERPHVTALLPLLADAWLPPGQPPALVEEDIQMLPLEMFQAALLEPGQRQDGYSVGRKMGVAEAEEKRRRKHARHSQSIAPPELPSPHLSSPHDQSPGSASTPLLPVPPPSSLQHRPSFPINTTRRPPASARPSFSTGGHGHRPSFSSSRGSHSTPGSYRGPSGGSSRGGPMTSPGRPHVRPTASFGRGGPFRGGRGGPSGPGGGRGGPRGYRHPSFSSGRGGPPHTGSQGGGPYVAGHKRGRESVSDPREAKRSRE